MARIKYETHEAECAQPIGLLVRIDDPDGGREDVWFVLLGTERRGWCWVLLNEDLVPVRTGTYFAPKDEALKLARRAAKRWYDHLCAEAAADIARTDIEEHERRCWDNIRNIGPTCF